MAPSLAADAPRPEVPPQNAQNASESEDDDEDDDEESEESESEATIRILMKSTDESRSVSSTSQRKSLLMRESSSLDSSSKTCPNGWAAWSTRPRTSNSTNGSKESTGTW